MVSEADAKLMFLIFFKRFNSLSQHLWLAWATMIMDPHLSQHHEGLKISLSTVTGNNNTRQICKN